MPDIKYQNLATKLLNDYQPRNDQIELIDKAINCDWDFPEGLPKWLMKSVSTDPHDSVLTATRVMATTLPNFKVMPRMADAFNKEFANKLESGLSWNFANASRRHTTSAQWDIVNSAVRYWETAAQVIYLPYQESVLKAMGKNTKRIEAARRFGDFAIPVHNPANVYTQWSEYGPEAVLTVRVQTADEFRASWGDLANKNKMKEPVEKGEWTYLTTYDMIDYDRRVVWGTWGETSVVATDGPQFDIMDKENDLGFLPFAVRRWGNSFTSDTDKQVMPMLDSVIRSGQWDMLNVIQSMDVSLSVKRAAQLQFVAEIPPGTSVNMNYDEPVGVAELPQGTQNFQALQAQQVDQRLAMQYTNYRNLIWQSTVARILQSLEAPAGVAYSTINQLLSAATASLGPYKTLAENTIIDIAYLMLCWVNYYGKSGHDKSASLYGKVTSKKNLGKDITIKWDEIDPEAVRIEATITPDTPIDKLQQVNAISILHREFNIPETSLLEDLGYNDPQELIRERAIENLQQNKLMLRIKDEQMALDAKYQMAIQANQANIAQQTQPPEEPQGMPEQPATEGLGGMGMNPAAGGAPPIEGAPGMAA